VAGSLREVILSVYSTFMRPQLESCTQLWGPHYKTDMNLLKQVQRRATKLIRGMENPSYEERPRAVELLSLEERLRGDLAAAF